MSELTTIARPYAKAAFDYAQENKQITEWADVLVIFSEIVANKRAYDFLANPTISRDDKVEFLLGFVPDLDDNINTVTTNFLKLLAEYSRLTVLPEIAHHYLNYRADYEKSMEVNVISAKPLENEQEKSLVTALSKRLNRDVSLSVQIDDSLLGGAIIQAGDFVIDGSVRGKLNKLAARLAV